jgi:hypothetical protein
MKLRRTLHVAVIVKWKLAFSLHSSSAGYCTLLHCNTVLSQYCTVLTILYQHCTVLYQYYIEFVL